MKNVEQASEIYHQFVAILKQHDICISADLGGRRLEWARDFPVLRSLQQTKLLN